MVFPARYRFASALGARVHRNPSSGRTPRPPITSSEFSLEELGSRRREMAEGMDGGGGDGWRGWRRGWMAAGMDGGGGRRRVKRVRDTRGGGGDIHAPLGTPSTHAHTYWVFIGRKRQKKARGRTASVFPSFRPPSLMQPRFCVGDEVCRFTQGFLEKGTVVELDPPRERIKVRREDGDTSSGNPWPILCWRLLWSSSPLRRCRWRLKSLLPRSPWRCSN